MQKYQDVVLKPDGSVIQGASVLVQSFPGAVTSTIYSDDGVTTQANPMTTDSLGRFAFYAADGDYQLVVSGNNIATQTVTGIQLLGVVFNPVFGGGVIPANGIKFPAVFLAESDPNTLDDYEEGTWLPTILSGGNSSGRTYSKQTGRYRKIGSLLSINAEVTILAKGSSTGGTQLGGLPFTAAVDSKAASIWYSNLTFTGNVIAEVTSNSINVFNVSSGTAATLIPDTGLAVGTSFVVSCSYNTS